MIKIEKCIICDSEKYEQAFFYESYGFYRCKNCKLLYQPVQPDLKNTLAIYNNDYFNYEWENEMNFFHLILLGLNDINFFSRYKNIKGTFLDIGCATGLLVNKMKKSGWDAKGIEICKESAEYGSSKYGIEIINLTLEQAKFPDNYFDIIHSSHLIEHLNDPQIFLKEIYRILKHDGSLIITTPNNSGLQAIMTKKNWRCIVKDHLFIFNKKNFSLLLKKNNFLIQNQVSWGGMAKGLVIDPIKKILDKSAKIFNWGDVMLFVAQKKISHKKNCLV